MRLLLIGCKKRRSARGKNAHKQHGRSVVVTCNVRLAGLFVLDLVHGILDQPFVRLAIPKFPKNVRNSARDFLSAPKVTIILNGLFKLKASLNAFDSFAKHQRLFLCDFQRVVQVEFDIGFGSHRLVHLQGERLDNLSWNQSKQKQSKVVEQKSGLPVGRFVVHHSQRRFGVPLTK
jgi:hypothetical protein